MRRIRAPMILKIQNLAWSCLALSLVVVVLEAQPADLVLRNGKLITMESGNSQAQALAARGGKIVAIGTNHQIKSYVGGSTKVVDLAGRLAIPGLIEGKGHSIGLRSSKVFLNLRHVTD